MSGAKAGVEVAPYILDGLGVIEILCGVAGLPAVLKEKAWALSSFDRANENLLQMLVRAFIIA